MRRCRALQTLTSWMALVAVLMVALAPTISFALGAGSSRAWIEVCSSTGSKWVRTQADPAEPTPLTAAAHPFEHCPYCSLQADALPVPLAPPDLPLPPPAADDMPAVFLHAARTLHAWVHAQPRAPPQFG